MSFGDWIGQSENIIFLVIGVVMLAAGFWVVTSRNLVHAVLMLVVALAGSAALFLMLGAEFVAWTVVLVYIGAVVVLFLFGLMITRAPLRRDPVALDHPRLVGARLGEAARRLAPGEMEISSGETTVTVRGHGRGGRNVEFLLALGVALRGHPLVHALAADTDGVDGQEEIAGALLGPDTLERARSLGLRPRERLDDNDGHGFFSALGDSVITGPTLTNVNDFRAILVAAPTPPAPLPGGGSSP